MVTTEERRRRITADDPTYMKLLIASGATLGIGRGILFASLAAESSLIHGAFTGATYACLAGCFGACHLGLSAARPTSHRDDMLNYVGSGAITGGAYGALMSGRRAGMMGALMFGGIGALGYIGKAYALDEWKEESAAYSKFVGTATGLTDDEEVGISSRAAAAMRWLLPSSPFRKLSDEEYEGRLNGRLEELDVLIEQCRLEIIAAEAECDAVAAHNAAEATHQ